MDEADVNELLVGYRNYQLEDVWGEPDVESENTWIWGIDEYTRLQVSCNNKDKVVVGICNGRGTSVYSISGRHG